MNYKTRPFLFKKAFFTTLYGITGGQVFIKKGKISTLLFTGEEALYRSTLLKDIRCVYESGRFVGHITFEMSSGDTDVEWRNIWRPKQKANIIRKCMSNYRREIDASDQKTKEGGEEQIDAESKRFTADRQRPLAEGFKDEFDELVKFWLDRDDWHIGVYELLQLIDNKASRASDQSLKVFREIVWGVAYAGFVATTHSNSRNLYFTWKPKILGIYGNNVDAAVFMTALRQYMQDHDQVWMPRAQRDLDLDAVAERKIEAPEPLLKRADYESKKREAGKAKHTDTPQDAPESERAEPEPEEVADAEAAGGNHREKRRAGEGYTKEQEEARKRWVLPEGFTKPVVKERYRIMLDNAGADELDRVNEEYELLLQAGS